MSFSFFDVIYIYILTLLLIILGNFPLSDHLVAINNKIREFEKLSPDEGVKFVKPFDSSPKRISLHGPLDPSKILS